MFKRCIHIIIVLIFSSGLLVGCKDAWEVDDNIYVIAVGLDKGVNNKAVITIQYPNYRTGRGGDGGDSQGGEQAGSNVHSIEAPSLAEGLDMMNMAVSRRISLIHIKMIVISEAVARDGVESMLTSFAKFRGARRTAFVIVTKGSAKEFIRENRVSVIGGSITKSLELMMSQSKNTGFFPLENFHDFYKDTLSPYGEASVIYAGVNEMRDLDISLSTKKSPFVTQEDIKPGELPRAGTAKREFVGSALFRGGKMVGSFNPYETRYMLMVKGEFKIGAMTIPDANSPLNGIIVRIRYGRKPKIKGGFDNGKPVIDVKLNIEADIDAIHSKVNYESVSQVEDLNKQLEKEIKEGVKKTIEKSQKEYKTDVFEFGKKFVGYFPTIDEWEKYKWSTHYPEAKVNVDVEVNVRRTGLTIDESPVIYEEEIE